MTRPSASLAGAADGQALEAAVLAAPIDVRERLARYFTPSALRRARLAERNGLVMAMAVGMTGTAEELADQIHRKLLRYQAGAWRFERDLPRPADDRNALAHRILTLSRGAVLAANSIRHLPWPKKPEATATANDDYLPERGDQHTWEH